MNEAQRPTGRGFFGWRTSLEAVFVLGAVVLFARGYDRATIKPGDLLQIHVIGSLQDQPIDGFYFVDQDGKVSLGPSYGRIAVENLSIDAAVAEVEKTLRRILREPEVAISRPTVEFAMQQLQAENRRLRIEYQRQPVSSTSRSSPDNASAQSTHYQTQLIPAVDPRTPRRLDDVKSPNEIPPPPPYRQSPAAPR